MLDKGPWVLAFDISKTLPKLLSDLELDIGLNRTQSLRVVSHCPYLIAQCARYKGRDLQTTAMALVDVGYQPDKLLSDILRFPSMLSTPPDRLRGWMSLLDGFGVKTENGLFSKTLRRAPFMFYVNPPYLLFQDESASVRETSTNDVSTTASGFVVYEAYRVLQTLSGYDFNMDKVVRSQPSILLCEASEVERRAEFLLNLFLDKTFQTLPPDQTSTGEDDSDSEAPDGQSDAQSQSQGNDNTVQSLRAAVLESEATEARGWAKKQLNGLLQSNPNVLSIEYEQMRSAANALLRAGVMRRDVVQLAKRYPPILGKNADDLAALISFFKATCGLRRSEIAPFVLRNPSVVHAKVENLQSKMHYLIDNLGGSHAMLRKFPPYFALDLDTEIRPRAEFAKAVGLDPFFNGMPFLFNAPVDELAYATGNQPEVYAAFYKAYMQMWESERARSTRGKKSVFENVENRRRAETAEKEKGKSEGEGETERERAGEEKEKEKKKEGEWAREGDNRFDLIEIDELLGEVDVGF